MVPTIPLPEGEREPSKDQVAFLKNLPRHMLGEGGAEDTQILDNLVTEAILRTYKRAAIHGKQLSSTHGRVCNRKITSQQ